MDEGEIIKLRMKISGVNGTRSLWFSEGLITQCRGMPHGI